MRAKAIYVLETCAARWGARLALVTSDDLADLAYGPDASAEGCARVSADVEFARLIGGLRDLAVPGALGDPDSRILRPDPADPIATAFFHLARVEEYVLPAVDAWWRFPAFGAAGFDGSALLARPVDDCFERLYALVASVRAARGEAALERRALYEDAAFAVALTHDVDSLRYWSPTQAVALPYRVATRLVRGRVREAVAEPAGALRLLRRGRVGERDPYWALEAICAVEREHGGASTFFLLGDHRFRLDGRDGRGYHRRLPEAIRRIAAQGAEIGLHAATPASLSTEELVRQKAYIEGLVGGAVPGIRFHNLLFRVPDGIDRIHQAGFLYDSTMGFAAVEGFRAGTAAPFPLFSLDLDRRLDVVEVPLALMDTTFLSHRYKGLSADRVAVAIDQLLERVESERGAVAVLWHNSGFDDQLTGGFGSLYRRMLAQVTERGGVLVPAGDVASRFAARLAAAAPV